MKTISSVDDRLLLVTALLVLMGYMKIKSDPPRNKLVLIRDVTSFDHFLALVDIPTYWLFSAGLPRGCLRRHPSSACHVQWTLYIHLFHAINCSEILREINGKSVYSSK